ncbi:MAG: hypothetical protein UX26_C0010G0002 [Parcubacteria group bacterium GW2011_GWC1_45_9]|nr:MAG: hypothetical protein UX26_C0010G0002 [Parcubacteria group bacterium GW2011_GWC1_45_9]
MIVVKGIATVKKAGSGNQSLELEVMMEKTGEEFKNIYVCPFFDEIPGIKLLQTADVNDQFHVYGVVERKERFTLTAVLGEIVAEPVCQPSG